MIGHRKVNRESFSETIQNSLSFMFFRQPTSLIISEL